MLRRLGVVAGQSTDIPPSAPTITTITPGNGTLSVNFTAPVSDGGRVITNYQFSTNNGSTWTTRSPQSASSPILITGLTNGVTYQVVIRAVNLEGPGDTSNMVSAKPYTTPSAPQSVTVTNGGGGGSAPTVSIAFSAPFSNGGDTITNYEYTTNGGSTWIARSPASTSSPIVIEGLSNSVSYSVGVRAVNAAGGGTSSAFTSIRPFPHFTSFSASTPAVSTYPYTTPQSNTYRTVNWSADVDDNFFAGTWLVRLMDGATEISRSSSFSTTAASSGSFTITYANNTYWDKTLTIAFDITDGASQSRSASTTVFVPAAESRSTTVWLTGSGSQNSGYTTGYVTGTGSNTQSGNIPSAVYTAARAWDSNNSTQLRYDNITDASGQRHTECFATFVVNEGSFGTLVAADATSAGIVINSSSLNINGFRFRTGIRNNTYAAFFDVNSGSWKGSGGAVIPADALLGGITSAYSIASTSVVQDGATWNTGESFSITNMTRNNTIYGGNFTFNCSVVQRGGAVTGQTWLRTILTDAQIKFTISYSTRYSSTVVDYR